MGQGGGRDRVGPRVVPMGHSQKFGISLLWEMTGSSLIAMGYQQAVEHVAMGYGRPQALLPWVTAGPRMLVVGYNPPGNSCGGMQLGWSRRDTASPAVVTGHGTRGDSCHPQLGTGAAVTHRWPSLSRLPSLAGLALRRKGRWWGEQRVGQPPTHPRSPPHGPRGDRVHSSAFAGGGAREQRGPRRWVPSPSLSSVQPLSGSQRGRQSRIWGTENGPEGWDRVTAGQG